jgi:hypothetical protein
MTWIAGNWVRLIPYAAVALALMAGYLYWHHQQAEIASLKQSLTVAEANGALAEKLARDDASALDIAAKQHAADDAAIQKHFEHQATAEKAKTIILESIDHAPASDDGPVAPVLLHALDCLRQPTPDAPGARDAFCQGNAPGGPPGMPAAAGTSPPQ